METIEQVLIEAIKAHKNRRDCHKSLKGNWYVKKTCELTLSVLLMYYGDGNVCGWKHWPFPAL